MSSSVILNDFPVSATGYKGPSHLGAWTVKALE
jgi:hypothetical protein